MPLLSKADFTADLKEGKPEPRSLSMAMSTQRLARRKAPAVKATIPEDSETYSSIADAILKKRKAAAEAGEGEASEEQAAAPELEALDELTEALEATEEELPPISRSASIYDRLKAKKAPR